MSKDEAEEALKNRQRTFDKNKCIEKYGLEIWEERQEKWKKSLKESYSKDSYPEKTQLHYLS